MWNRTSFGDTALYSFTGTFTRPKLIDPLQRDRATFKTSCCWPAHRAAKRPAAPARLSLHRALRTGAERGIHMNVRAAITLAVSALLLGACTHQQEIKTETQLAKQLVPTDQENA